MSKSHLWMPFYVKDYIADTRHLSVAQHGAYLHLILHYWQTGGLPTDDRDLARICLMDFRQFRRNKKTLQAMFSGAEWRHARIDRELEKANTLRLKRQFYGAKGGRREGRTNSLGKLALVPPWKPKG